MKNVFGKYRAIVVNIQDKLHMGRILVKCPQIYGESDSPYCLPCMPFTGNNYGTIMLPDINSTVWIEFEEGDTDYPVWTGGWWTQDKTPYTSYTDANYKTIIKSKTGHTILLNDKVGEESIQIVDKSGSKLTLSSTGINIESSSDLVLKATGNITIL
jgi:uncharacterized protein involved in type VI secretion and phage assembly